MGRCQRTTARKSPAISTRRCSCQKSTTHVQPTLGQHLASHTRSWWEKSSTRSPNQDFVHRVAQKLANSWSTPRQLPIPWEVAGVFLAVVLWQHPKQGVMTQIGPNAKGVVLLKGVFLPFKVPSRTPSKNPSKSPSSVTHSATHCKTPEPFLEPSFRNGSGKPNPRK